MLGFEYAGGEPLRGIVAEDRNPGLSQHRPTIIDLIDQMNRDSGFSDTAGQHCLVDALSVHSLPARRRQQGRVSVDDPAAIRRDYCRRNQPEIPGQHEQVDLVLPERFQPAGRTGGL
jgi:hypothetical protein